MSPGGPRPESLPERGVGVTVDLVDFQHEAGWDLGRIGFRGNSKFLADIPASEVLT